MKQLLATICCGLALVAGADYYSTYIYTGTSENNQFRQYGYRSGELFAVSNATEQLVSPPGLFLRKSNVTNEFTVTPPTGYALTEWVLAELKTGVGLPLPSALTNVVRAATWTTETVAIPGSGVQFDHLWEYMILAPCFDWLRYELVYRPNDGSTSAMSRESYLYTNSVTVANAPKARDGYTFQGWALDAQGKVRFTAGQTIGAAELGVTRNGPVDLYAVWEKKDLPVVLDANGGSVTPDSVIGQVDEPLALPTPVWENHEFLGWFTAADGGTCVADGAPMPATLTRLYAHWQLVKHTLMFGSSNPRWGWVSPEGERIKEYGDEISFSATPSTGYRFAGWNDGVMVASRTVIAVSNAVYWARFEPNIHTVTFVYKTATGEDAADVQTVRNGERAWPPADALCNAWTGHTFTGWSDAFNYITSDCTITACYEATTGVTDGAAQGTIFYLANGGSGRMSVQTYDRSQPTVLLSENAFTREDATFVGWSTDPLATTNEVIYTDGAVVTDPASGGHVSLYAVWAFPPPETATIHFCANGGRGWMEPLTVDNSAPTTLPVCTFESAQTMAFQGWARMPAATDADYADGEVLPVVPEETLILYAVWQEKMVGPLAAAVGAPFELVPSAESVWVITEDLPDADAVDFTTGLTVAADAEGSVKLAGQIKGPGMLTFVGFSEGRDNWFFTKPETESVWTTFTELPQEGGWFTNTLTWTATEQMTMQWERRTSGALWIASVTWTPTREEKPFYAQFVVTARVAVDGHNQTGIEALVGCTVSGDATATRPGTYTATVTLTDGYAWPDGETETSREVVWEMKPGVEVAAYLHTVEDLSYTGAMQTGVVAIAGCTVTGNTATDAGDYQAVATLLPGGSWADGETAQSRLIPWSIAQASYDMSAVRFVNETFVADGTSKSLSVTGDLPDGVFVTYENNDQTEPGVYIVTAHFTGDAVSYAPIADLTATLTIESPFGSNGQFEPVWDDLPIGAVSAFDSEAVYDGQPHTIDTNALFAAFAPFVPQPIRLEFADSIYSSSWSATPLTVTDAGQRTIAYRMATATDGYVRHAARITVTPRVLDEETVVTVKDQTWTGQPLEPPVTVSIGDLTLTHGQDFTTAFTNNVAVGTATVTVTGCGNCMGTRTAAFRINRAVYDMSGVRFTDATVSADGKPKSLVISGTLPAGVTVSYSGNAQTAPGVYTVTAHFTGDAATHEPIPDLSAVLTIRDRLHPDGPSEDGPTLYPSSAAAPMDTSYAATFSGWLRDADGAVAGLITVKTAKAAAGKTCKSTIAVTWLATGKKQTFKATVDPAANDSYPQDEYGLIYTDRAILGSFQGYTVELAEDFSKSKQADEKARVAEMPLGSWSLAFAEGDGYSVFTVTVARNGKCKVAGTLSDGTKVSVTAQGVLGEDRLFAIPVLYAKRTVRLAFVLWITDGELAVSSVPADWTFVAGGALTAVPDGVQALTMDVPAARAYLTAVDGVSLLPDRFTVTGNKWNAGKAVGKVKIDKASGLLYLDCRAGQTPSNVGALKLTCTARTGVVKGSFKLYYLMGDRIKYDTVTLTGAVVDGRLFATGVIKKAAAVFRIESE